MFLFSVLSTKTQILQIRSSVRKQNTTRNLVSGTNIKLYYCEHTHQRTIYHGGYVHSYISEETLIVVYTSKKEHRTPVEQTFFFTK